MFNFFENLRRKPKHHRRMAALGISLFVTAVIFLAWLFLVLPEGQSVVLTKEKPIVKSPFASLKDGFNKSLEVVSKEFSEIKKEANQSLQEFFPPSDSPTDSSENNGQTFQQESGSLPNRY